MKNKSYLYAVATVAIATLALVVTAPMSSAAINSKTLTVFLSADTNVQVLWEQKLVPAFIAANPDYAVKVVLDLHGAHDAQTVAKLASASLLHKDPGYDVMDGGFVTQIAASGLLMKFTSAIMQNLKDVPKIVVAAGGQGGVPYRASSVLLAYNTTKVPTPPKTLDALLAWIKANPGKFTYNAPATGGSGKAFVATVLDKFVPAADRAKMSVAAHPELEGSWDQGFATLAGLNASVYQKGVYPNGNTAILNLLASGELSMAPVWSDQFITGRNNGVIPANISTIQISNPSFTGGAAYLGIPKSSPRRVGAFKLVNWVLSPAAQEIISTQMSGYPVIPLDKLSLSVSEKFKTADIGNLRPPYFNSMGADMASQWAAKVPGK